MSRRRRRRKSYAGTIVLVLILILLLAGAGGGVAYLMHHRNTDVFLDNTYFMGEDVSGLRAEEILDRIAVQVDAVDISMTEFGQPALSGKLADYGYTLDAGKAKASLEQEMAEQKDSLGDIFRSLTGTVTELQPEVLLQFDENIFNQKVAVANLPTPRVASADATIVQDSAQRRVIVTPEVYGNEFDEGQFRSWMREQIDGSIAANGMTNIALAFPEEMYIKPQVTADASGMTARAEALNAYAGAEITYDFGSQTEVLDYDTIISWLDVNGNTATLNEDKVKEWVDYLRGKYNTLRRQRTFTTTDGETITIPDYANEYGYVINADEETAQLKADVVSGAPVEREPCYVRLNDWDNPFFLKRDGVDDLAGTYVEVSIKKQHLWYYIDGELYLESKVVTGDVTKDRGTTPGAYPLSYKQTDYVLTGGNGNGAYATHVDYWMPFHDGQGLHDASWRSNFGGKIYKGHGSHGCVNLPKKVAREIYDVIKAGTAIIIYDD